MTAPTRTATGQWASLRNLALIEELILLLKERKPHLPGIGVFFGRSGDGKTWACAWAAAGPHMPFYVQAGETWTRKVMLVAIARAMGLIDQEKPCRQTLDELARLIKRELSASRRPLVIDEADKLIERHLIELVRELHDDAPGATIVLVGEEALPTKIKRIERVYGRVRKFQPARSCDLEDARQLARLYCPKIEVTDDLLEDLRVRVGGSTRRLAVNLEEVNAFALGERLKRVSLADYSGQPVFTGAAPPTRNLEEDFA